MKGEKQPSIVAIGMFDGVHRGHRYVLQQLLDESRRLDVRPIVVTFDCHPKSVICAERAPRLITDTDRKCRYIRDLGIDDIAILPFNNHLRSLTAEQFAQKILIPQFDVRYVLLGYDNGFGSDRLRSPEQYRDVLRRVGIEVIECRPLPGLEVSSTLIRNKLGEGDIKGANNLLGNNHVITGKVVGGKQLGRTIGFPTANIDTGTVLLPRSGVYAARVIEPVALAGTPVMLNIGTAPTVNHNPQGPVTVEAHLITDADLDLYGCTVSVELVERLRDEQTFSSLEALQAALARDRATTLTILGSR